MTNITNVDDLKKIVQISANLPFFHPTINFSLCNICEERFNTPNLKTCQKCKLYDLIFYVIMTEFPKHIKTLSAKV